MHKILPYEEVDWFRNQEQLTKAFEDYKVKTVIEVGSYMGQSAIYMAGILPEDGRIYCIDTWLGGKPTNNVNNSEQFRNLYSIFISNIYQKGVAHLITPVRMSSEEAALHLDLKADLIYIDADHSAQSCLQDILMWSFHLSEGGVICGDDWDWDSVRDGVYGAARLMDKAINIDKAFWKLV